MKFKREAYHKSFTFNNIRSGFVKTGLWPFKPDILLDVPRSLSNNNPETILSVQGIKKMLEQRKQERKDAMGLQPTV